MFACESLLLNVLDGKGHTMGVLQLTPNESLSNVERDTYFHMYTLA